jgi:hypothetical protein
MRYNPKDDDSRQTIDEYGEETGHWEEVESYKNSTYAWNPLEDATKILRVTKSSLGTFAWCPQQYYLEKFKGLRSEQRYYHDRGLNVHDMVEYFWANFDKTDEALKLIADERYDEAKQLLYDTIPMPTTPYSYGEEDQIEQWLDWQFERLIQTNGKYWKPAKVEANIQATRFVMIDNTPVPIHMNGYIDTIFRHDDDSYALMELKTGKWKKNKMSNMRQEMGFYRMMLENSNHHEFLPITHWGWEFPGGNIEGGENTKIHYEKANSSTMKSVEKNLERLVKAHIDMDFAPNPWLGKSKPEVPLEEQTLKCNWCDYKADCSFWSLTDEFLDEIMEDEKNE